MDRNIIDNNLVDRHAQVALRKESVDRNSLMVRLLFSFSAVALRKESVDRNVPGQNLVNSICLSLSARRAWIEMPKL